MAEREAQQGRLFRTILVAVDGSQHAQRALDAGMELAQRCEARMLLLHAVELNPARADLAGRVSDAARDVYRRVGLEVADQVLDSAAQRARAYGLTQVERLVVDGDAATAIVEAAQTRQVDLILMGTRGLTGLRGLALGSVAHKVMSMAHCPVMVVR